MMVLDMKKILLPQSIPTYGVGLMVWHLLLNFSLTWILSKSISGERYLAVLYDYLHQELYNYHMIQADETLVLVNRDGHSAGTKSYTWVYRLGHLYTDKQIVLYNYHKT